MLLAARPSGSSSLELLQEALPLCPGPFPGRAARRRAGRAMQALPVGPQPTEEFTGCLSAAASMADSPESAIGVVCRPSGAVGYNQGFTGFPQKPRCAGPFEAGADGGQDARRYGILEGQDSRRTGLSKDRTLEGQDSRRYRILEGQDSRRTGLSKDSAGLSKDRTLEGHDSRRYGILEGQNSRIFSVGVVGGTEGGPDPVRGGTHDGCVVESPTGIPDERTVS